MLVPEPGVAVLDRAGPGVGLDQFGQVAHVPDEAQRKLTHGPDPTPALDLKSLLERVELQGLILEIAQAQASPPCVEACAIQPTPPCT